ncbi:hypothetical protein BN14_09902 [Rhizoctonia solani AG-1 IB]|uniref:Uncharacterized protein n=1 Tax=Thanatephorus cucumeris (strain AG1-IB / isolate 7/3/14) TaxID=1108050 RepID=M5CGA6_THACB|nr:hypothetical protein BN14_09902 [Rhizoctonia solani AG-1 IB]
MGNIKFNAPVVGLPVPTPIAVPRPDELHPVLVQVAIFLVLCYSHIVAAFGLILPSVPGEPNLGPHTIRHGRGVNRAQVVAPEPLPLVLAQGIAQPMPDECWRRLVFFVCSPMAIVGLSILVGSATAPPVGGVDPTHVVDVINEPIDHVSGNVASASLTGSLILQAGLKLLEFASEVAL